MRGEEELPAWTRRWVRGRLGPPPLLPPQGVQLAEARSLGPVLRAVRMARKLSRMALARRAGVNREEIASIEDRGRQPSFEIIERLGRALGFSGFWLLKMARRHANAEAALGGTARNPGMGTLSISFSNPPTQGELATFLTAFNDLLNQLTRV